MYAVIDLETTGLNPARHDRIVEIAVVHVSDTGELTREWSTLVNPHRDMGPQHIHGIAAAEARRAPSFADVAPAIVDLLRGRVVVAHNLAFDAPFLAHQFRRLGVDVPLSIEAGLCTMTLAATYLPDSGRSLAACCEAAGVPLDRAHCALDDTRAAAMLLSHYIRSAGAPVPWSEVLRRSSTATWPDLPPRSSGVAVGRRAPGTDVPSFLGRLVDQLPRVVAPPAADSYLAILDHTLIDRQISETEADVLVEQAALLGLGRDDVLEMHRDYLRALGIAAIESGVVSQAERHELHAVAELLGLPPGAVDAALDPAPAVRLPRQATRRFRLRHGDAVAFTGQTREPRTDLEERARAGGLEVTSMVSRTTRLLVAADVDTMSGKARAARQFGIPIVEVTTFEKFLGALTATAIHAAGTSTDTPAVAPAEISAPDSPK